MAPIQMRILQFVTERLVALLTRPAAWGSMESVELQVLQLLEVRAIALQPDITSDQLRAIQDQYVQLVDRQFPSDPPETLAERVQRHGREAEFSTLLDSIVNRIISSRDSAAPGFPLQDGPEDGPHLKEAA